jgi:mono/diheme cytochrome c family protein
MLARVRAVPGAEFDTWVSGQVKGAGDLGRQTFQGACGPCHGLSGKGLIGPPLQGNATLANPKSLIQLLENGKNAMPPVGRGWNSRQLQALVQYVQKRFAGGG